MRLANNVYIYYRIEYRKQIHKLYPDKLDQLEAQICSLLSEAGGTPYEGNRSIFQFATLYKESLYNAIVSTEALRALFNDYRQYLYGVTIILTANRGVENLPNHLHELSLMVPAENGTWLEHAARSFFLEYLEDTPLEEYSLLMPAKMRTKRGLSIEERYNRFVKREDILSSFKREFNRWVYRQDEPSFLVIRGHFLEESIGILRDILEDKAGLIEDYFLLEPFKEIWDPWYPFVHFINPSVLPHLEQYFTMEDRKKWSKARVFLENICKEDWYLYNYDQMGRDYFEALALYWLACLKKLETTMTPPVIIIRNPRVFEGQSRALLDSFLGTLQKAFPKQKFLFLMEEKENVLPPIKNSSCRQLRTPSLIDSHLKLKISDVFPDLAAAEEAVGFYNSCNYNLVDTFFFLENKTEGIEKDHLGEREKFFFDRDLCTVEILYIGYCSRFFIARQQLIEFFHTRGNSYAELEERMKRLESLGFLRFFGSQGGLEFRPLNVEVFTRVKDFNQEELIKDFNQFLEMEIKGGKIRSYSGLLSYTSCKGLVDPMLWVVNKVSDGLLRNREVELSASLFKRPFFQGCTLTEQEQEGYYNIQSAALLRGALLTQSLEEIEGRIEAGEISLEKISGPYQEEFLLQQAHFQGVSGQAEKAQEKVKRCLFQFQKSGNHYGVIKANVALALTLLNQRKLQGASDYFDIAMRVSEQLQDRHSALGAFKFIGLSSYLFGNLSKALRDIDKYIPCFEDEQNWESLIYQYFLKGRILFDLGHYKEASKVFQQVRQLSKNFCMDQESRVTTLWTARSLSFSRDASTAESLMSALPTSLEAAYFLAETAYLRGNPMGGLYLLEVQLERYNSTPIYIQERDCWSDGYRLVEGRTVCSGNYEDVLFDQARGFYFFLLGLSGQTEKAWKGLQPYCRTDRAYHQQPFGYYYFLYAAILIEQFNLKVPDQTVETMSFQAFKMLQTWAGRLDNQQIKQHFFRKNYWNNEIMKRAHQFNFV